MSDQFGRASLQGALKSWHDLESLGKHPLCQTQMVRDQAGQNGLNESEAGQGLALRQILADEIEALRPDEQQPDIPSRRWHAYLILTDRYVNGRSPEFIQDYLAVAPRTYFYKQNKAVDHLTANLRLREQSALQESDSASPLNAENQPHSKERTNRLILLDKVEHFWIEGVLKASLPGREAIALGKESLPEAVAQPWGEQLGSAYQVDRWSADDSLIDIFDQADHSLLILGAPGAGKSTALLMMARELSSQARQNEDLPIPVVLKLGSWAENRQPLSDWAVDELVTQYRIPRSMAREWLDANQLLLLLDGLDEVSPVWRAGCIGEINRFPQTHGLTGIVVTSRLSDYLAAEERLRLGAAVRLLPLSDEQVATFIAGAGLEMNIFRDVVETHTDLQTVMRSPLMLSVIKETYGSGMAEFETSGAPENNPPEDFDQVTQQRLLAQYVDRVFVHHRPQMQYGASRVRQWLSYLAYEMTIHHRPTIQLEQLQPSWLLTAGRRRQYIFFTRLFSGLFLLSLLWILVVAAQIVQGPDFKNELALAVQAWAGQAPVAGDLIAYLIFGLASGLILGATHILFFEHVWRTETTPKNEVRRRWMQAIVSGVVIASFEFLLLLRVSDSSRALILALALAIYFAFATRYIHGASFRHDISHVEALGWSWPGFWRGLLVAMLIGALLLISLTFLFTFRLGLIGGLGLGLILLLVGGLRPGRLERMDRPNQGTWLSARNGLRAAGLLGLPCAILLFLLTGDPTAALMATLVAMLIIWVIYGGLDLLYHLVLRALLYRQGTMPRNVVRFLEYATELILLRQAGSGYLFVHPLLQEHFASRFLTHYSPIPIEPAHTRKAKGDLL